MLSDFGSSVAEKWRCQPHGGKQQRSPIRHQRSTAASKSCTREGEKGRRAPAALSLELSRCPVSEPILMPLSFLPSVPLAR